MNMEQGYRNAMLKKSFVSNGDTGISYEVRPEVVEFAAMMELKLRKNDHKTGWKDQPIEAHLKLLNIEMMELEVALEFLTFEDACKELVDIANFAMIIRNKLMTQGKAAFRDRPVAVASKELSPGLDAAIQQELDHPPKDIMK